MFPPFSFHIGIFVSEILLLNESVETAGIRAFLQNPQALGLLKVESTSLSVPVFQVDFRAHNEAVAQFHFL